MIDPQRLRELMGIRGVSQSELARRIGVSQATINKLAVGHTYGSKHLHRIARELGTTPAYLTGEIDNPDEGAPPPPPVPRVQFLMMPVSLPSEAALAEMYEGQLLALGRLSGAELARALAKRLPKALAQLQAGGLRLETVDDVPLAEDAARQTTNRPARRQSQRT